MKNATASVERPNEKTTNTTNTTCKCLELDLFYSFSQLLKHICPLRHHILKTVLMINAWLAGVDETITVVLAAQTIIAGPV